MSYRRKHIKTKIHKLKKPKNKIIKRRVFLAAVLLLSAVLIVFYFLIFSSRFQIKEIEISGNQKIQSGDLQSFIFSRLARVFIAVPVLKIESRSVFLIDYKKLKTDVLSNFPAIEEAKISRKSFTELTAEIREREPVGIFCISPSECFSIDKNGVIFEQLSNIAGGMILIKNPQDAKEAVAGDKVIAENVIKAILNIEKNLKNNFKINIEEALVSNPLRIDIKTAEKWQIYFNLESDMDLQIAKMNLLLSNEISPDSRKNLKYIDLRFKDKAYYK